MKIIEPSYEILDRRTLTAAQKIEYAGRTAYKSEGLIEEDSAVPFLEKMLENEHFPVVEFSNLHIRLLVHNIENYDFDGEMVTFVGETMPLKFIAMSVAFSKAADGSTTANILLSGTVRAFMELVSSCYRPSNGVFFNEILRLLGTHNPYFPLSMDIPNRGSCAENVVGSFVTSEYVLDCLKESPEMEDHLMVAVRFICNRAVTHELVRHRPCSFIQESQRYCRYSADKFGNEVTFIAPSAFYKECLNMDDPNEELNIWIESMRFAEEQYFKLLKTSSPQAARTVLPNSCKTEIILYTTITEWRHIEKMRVPTSAEPSMRQLTVPLFAEFYSDENKLKWE